MKTLGIIILLGIAAFIGIRLAQEDSNPQPQTKPITVITKEESSEVNQPLEPEREEPRYCYHCKGGGNCEECGTKGYFPCRSHDTDGDGYCTDCMNDGYFTCTECGGKGYCTWCDGRGTL